LSNAEGVEWAIRSMRHAFSVGVECCSFVPVRGGNGIMEQLRVRGEFAPPEFSALEEVLEAGLALQQGRVFVDLWDAEKFLPCPDCGPARIARLREMKLTQKVRPSIGCG